MSEREWRFYVSDMIGFCEKVLAFTHGLQQEQLVADAMRFDTTVRNLELIGEAASHIPQDVRDTYSAIPWRMLIATRNQLIHGFWAWIAIFFGASCKPMCPLFCFNSRLSNPFKHGHS